MTNQSDRSGVIVLGASSAIAQALARRLAERGARLGLVARDADKLAAVAMDLKVRGAGAVASRAWDLAQGPQPGALAALAEEMGGADTVVIAYGALGDQAQAESDLAAAAELLQVNFTSATLWALEAAQVLAATIGDKGLIVGLSSVAGDRGRKSNFIYGAAKGGLAIVLQGIAHRAALAGGPKAMAIKLGFVDTPMTAQFKKGGPLWATPDQAAAAILKAMAKPSPIVYAPWFWRWILLAIRLTPSAIFNKADI